MGHILEDIREEFLPSSAKSTTPTRKARNSQDREDVQKSPTLKSPYQEQSQNHTPTNSHDDSKMRADQNELMGNHLLGMKLSTLKSMLKCLKKSGSSPEVQKMILLRIGELISEED